METPRLTVALSQIGELRAQEVVNLSDRRRSIPGALLAGFFRRLWMSLTVRVPVDAVRIQSQPPRGKRLTRRFAYVRCLRARAERAQHSRSGKASLRRREIFPHTVPIRRSSRLS